MKHKKDNPWGKPAVTAAAPSACTGPVTAEGKEISSRNALTHGCTSNATLILPGEDPQAFKALEAAWFGAYRPGDPAEIHLVHELVEADWLLQRANRAYSQKEASVYRETPDTGDWTEEQQKSIGRFLRYRTTHTNTVAKRRKAIEDYRRCRQLEQARDQAMRHKEERLNMAKAKLEVLAKKQTRTTETKATSTQVAPDNSSPLISQAPTHFRTGQ